MLRQRARASAAPPERRCEILLVFDEQNAHGRQSFQCRTSYSTTGRIKLVLSDEPHPLVGQRIGFCRIQWSFQHQTSPAAARHQGGTHPFILSVSFSAGVCGTSRQPRRPHPG
jgi:hypothetical protein